MDQIPTCPDCREPMESGVIPDMTYGAIAPTRWNPGSPPFDISFWGRLQGDGKQLNRGDSLAVATYRCPQCGLLRSYAQ